MMIKAEVSIDNTSLSYNVKDQVDGLFIAQINELKWGEVIPYSIPQKLHLYRTPEGWKGDHERSDIIKAIGRQIDKAIKP